MGKHGCNIGTSLRVAVDTVARRRDRRVGAPKARAPIPRRKGKEKGKEEEEAEDDYSFEPNRRIPLL